MQTQKHQIYITEEIWSIIKNWKKYILDLNIGMAIKSMIKIETNIGKICKASKFLSAHVGVTNVANLEDYQGAENKCDWSV